VKKGEAMDGFSKWISKTLTPENLGRWLTFLGGRRFILTIGAGLVTSVLVWYGKITPEVYRDVIIGTVGIFIAGTTIQKNTLIKASTPSQSTD
jgi:hypothetical protein